MSMQSDIASAPEGTFVRVAEVWVPDGDRLVHAGGDYGNADSFASASVFESFERGEGLPGKAWESGRPIVLKSFDGSYFKRTKAAHSAGLTSAVAIPVFAGRELKAVLMLLCGSDTAHAGALELWEYRDERLGLLDGYYGTAKEFAATSRAVEFAHGQGLPGGVWSTRTPILMRDISRGSTFLRSAVAAKAGLKTGLGVPVPTPGDNIFVLTILSSIDTPIARRFEIWDARADRVGASRTALLVDGLCEREGALWAAQNPPVDPTTASAWKGPIGQVLGTGLPYVQRGSSGLPGGYTTMFALPIYHEAELAHVVACYL